jgi:glycerophosphoryl diester phosphodiesterase
MFLNFLFSVIIMMNPDLMRPNPAFDWQGHRGARGLAPENTVSAFLEALKYPAITTLELDVVISADSQVVVSHEPWMSATICRYPDGSSVTEGQRLNLYQMPYDSIRAYDCGSKGHPRFRRQEPRPACKPTLAEVVREVNRYCREQGRPFPAFNIELKARPEWDERYTPSPAAFVRLVYREIQALDIADRSCLQSFDPRILRLLHQTDDALTLSYLLEQPFSFQQAIGDLGFQPAILSPHYKLVSPELIGEAHQSGIRVIPWTVNRTTIMRRLKKMGVDGIITDYPNRIPEKF